MKDLKEYNIAFSGLKNDIHQFDYQIDKSFFDHFEEADIQDAKLQVNVEMEKQETMLILHFDISGSLTTTCDRCLEPCNLDISKVTILIVKFGEKYEEISDDVIVIPRSMNSLDISQYIYEFSMLALPLQRVHATIGGVNGCNENMMSFLSNNSDSDHQEIDPRWEILRELNN
ncbi:MAG: DUF177 domain-containing protein [Bacteroidales bacterium]|nr:DUF177 domain-containing protein [Bacteroidales bacterium]